MITEKRLKKHWVSEKPIIYKGKKWRVGRMSYGDYFLEPIMSKNDKKKYYGENKSFHPKTIWLEKKIIRDKYGGSKIVYVEE